MLPFAMVDGSGAWSRAQCRALNFGTPPAKVEDVMATHNPGWGCCVAKGRDHESGVRSFFIAISAFCLAYSRACARARKGGYPPMPVSDTALAPSEQRCAAWFR